MPLRYYRMAQAVGIEPTIIRLTGEGQQPTLVA